MKIRFASPTLPKSNPLVIGVLADRKLLDTAQQVDEITGGAVGRAMKAGRFRGDSGQSLTILAPAGTGASRIVLIGLGDAAKFNRLAAQAFGGAAYRHVSGHGNKTATIAVDAIEGADLGDGDIAANVAYGARLASYRFDKYRTREKPDAKPSLEGLTISTGAATAARRLWRPLDKIADGVFFTRDLVSEPANVIYPATLAQEAETLAKMGVKVQVLDEKRMARLKMGALLGVAQGSANRPRLVVLRWDGTGNAPSGRPIAFVGKGVTFDTGGISIKPSANMEDMKWDMGGSAVVLGLMKALAGRKAKVNAVGIVGLVENMPSGTAQRPGDVVHTMSGQTVEVINTDAEGRLVLADAMWYCQEQFKPHTMIDLATLTGAIIVALGHHNAGLFANDDELAGRLAGAAEAVGEPIWRMPLGEAYNKMIDSDIADMKNVGSRWGGAVTAAQFLNRFVKDDVKWAHLDIAGVTWSNKSAVTVPKGGTAFGVRLLDRLVSEHYES